MGTNLHSTTLVDIEYTRDKPGGGGFKERVRKNNHCIGRMPIMLRCSHCVLNDKTDAEMAAMVRMPKELCKLAGVYSNNTH
jgi:hypothetical protein